MSNMTHYDEDMIDDEGYTPRRATRQDWWDAPKTYGFHPSLEEG